jgi:hypothetical protein
LASRPQGDNAKEVCGAVRVEIRRVQFPQGISGSDSSLG